jgi:hypothetical protein
MSVHIVSNQDEALAQLPPSPTSPSSCSARFSLHSLGSSLLGSMRRSMERVSTASPYESTDSFGNRVLKVHRLGATSTIRFVDVHVMPFFSVLDVLLFVYAAEAEQPSQEELQVLSYIFHM